MRISLAALLTKITTLFADNVNGEIAESDLREVTTDMKDSFTHLDAHEAHANAVNNPHNVTKSQVGLGNADNTSDANKPISTATQAALNAKIGAEANNVTNATIKFDKLAVFGSYGSPLNGDFSLDLSNGPLVGLTVRAVHQDAGEPNYPAEFIVMNGSWPYSAGNRNYYTFIFLGDNKILYRIDQE